MSDLDRAHEDMRRELTAKHSAQDELRDTIRQIETLARSARRQVGDLDDAPADREPPPRRHRPWWWR